MELLLYQHTKLTLEKPPIIISTRQFTPSRVKLIFHLPRSVQLILPGAHVVDNRKDDPNAFHTVTTLRKIGDTIQIRHDDKTYSLTVIRMVKQVPSNSPEAAQSNFVVLSLEE